MFTFKELKTLRQLKDTCWLIVEFKQPSFVDSKSPLPYLFPSPNRAFIFYNREHKVYYVYTKIKFARVESFQDLDSARYRLIQFIYNTLI